MKKTGLIIIMLIVAFSLKAQLKKFSVEVPSPPKFILPESIQSFTIMNRSMNSQFSNELENEQQLNFYKQNFDANVILLDSTAADSTIQFAGDLLFNSNRYDIVIPVERNIERLQSHTDTPEPLSWSDVKRYCDTYVTDALLVLENFAIRAVLNYDTGYDNSYPFSQKYHYASMDFYSRAHWRIYDPNEEKILFDYVMSDDTIFWDAADYNLSDLFKQLPTVKKASIETGWKLASDFTKLIAPSWSVETRYYYLLKKTEIDSSVQLAANGDWYGALENWLNYTDEGSKAKRSKVMLNVALAYEMTGDIDKAIEYAKASLKESYREVTNHYLKILLKRKVVLNK